MQIYKIHWQESKNGVTINCDLDIAVHPTIANLIVLTIPGVDGTVDGHEQKYLRIAEDVQSKQECAVVRISNPFITSFHWESNIRHILEFIEENKQNICGNDQYELRIMAHSAGAAITARIAHEIPQITQLLLINPAITLDSPSVVSGLDKFTGQATILIGTKDPSYPEVMKLNSNNKIKIIPAENADHNFSGKSFDLFLNAASNYLFDTK